MDKQELLDRIEKLTRFKRGAIMEMFEAEQILGQVLGYPYADESIGGDGKTVVVVPDPISTVAQLAANEIIRLRHRVEALNLLLDAAHEYPLVTEICPISWEKVMKMLEHDPVEDGVWVDL